MGEVILTMKGIDKSFPGVHALDHVDLEIRKGEVLALMGENGAGKSTLMKVLTGIYKKDSGTITYEGKEIEFANPRDAQAAGVVIVHQELNMMNHLTVAQNIFIGREIMNGKLINDDKMNKEAAKLFDRLNIKIDPTEKMGNLTLIGYLFPTLSVLCLFLSIISLFIPSGFVNPFFSSVKESPLFRHKAHQKKTSRSPGRSFRIFIKPQLLPQ